MVRKIGIIIFFVLLVLVQGSSFGQPGPPCGTPPCGGPGGNPGPPVPLGGIELLIAAGAAFGAKRWFDKNKKK